MFWTNWKVSTRKLALSFAVLCFAAIGLVIGSQLNSADASTDKTAASGSLSPAATFPGTNLGGIEDGGADCSPSPGPARDVMFNVTGLSGAPTNVQLNLTFGGPVHTWAGDIVSVLIAPNGASHTIFGRTGATTATSLGDSSDLAGPYAFADSAAAPPSGGWWQAATAATGAVPIAAGTYRTTNSGGAGAVNPMPPTTMNTAFAGVANPNGTWTLRITDGCAGDTGSVAAANLTVDAGPVGPPADAPVDFNGDGRTDYAVVRNIGVGPAGQIRWFYAFSSGGPISGFDWGLGVDFFVPEDYDNDNKDDFAVWRPGAPGVAAFYIHNSATNTARVEPFGQTGDDPTVVDDYNNDGAADLAVYRDGATGTSQSVWYFRATPGGPTTFVPWGLGGDIPAPGDYDGDGSADFVVQRASGGAGVFYRRLSSGAFDVIQFGNSTDLIVPGDYDDDGKTDIAVARTTGGNWTWYYEPSGTAGITSIQATFGLQSDFPTQGDYDGDGRTDLAVWRESGSFWVLNLANMSVTVFGMGSPGDYPVANYNAH